jgi:uncharacterized membrane protein
MHQDVQRHKTMIDASGLGLLPGIGLALALAVFATGALVLENWIFTVAVLVFVLGGAACIAAVVYLISDDTD